MPSFIQVGGTAVNAALTVGAVLLIGYLIKAAFSD